MKDFEKIRMQSTRDSIKNYYMTSERNITLNECIQIHGLNGSYYRENMRHNFPDEYKILLSIEQDNKLLRSIEILKLMYNNQLKNAQNPCKNEKISEMFFIRTINSDMFKDVTNGIYQHMVDYVNNEYKSMRQCYYVEEEDIEYILNYSIIHGISLYKSCKANKEFYHLHNAIRMRIKRNPVWLESYEKLNIRKTWSVKNKQPKRKNKYRNLKNVMSKSAFEKHLHNFMKDESYTNISDYADDILLKDLEAASHVICKSHLRKTELFLKAKKIKDDQFFNRCCAKIITFNKEAKRLLKPGKYYYYPESLILPKYELNRFSAMVSEREKCKRSEYVKKLLFG